MVRSISAVVVGYLVMAVAIMVLFAIWFRDPNTLPTNVFMVVAAAYGLVAAAAGGVVTALIAKRAETNHAIVLAALCVVLAVVSMVVQWGQEPLWFQVANTAAISLGVFLGAWSRVQLKARTQV